MELELHPIDLNEAGVGQLLQDLWAAGQTTTTQGSVIKILQDQVTKQEIVMIVDPWRLRLPEIDGAVETLLRDIDCICNGGESVVTGDYYTLVASTPSNPLLRDR